MGKTTKLIAALLMSAATVFVNAGASVETHLQYHRAHAARANQPALQNKDTRGSVRAVTIPVTIRPRGSRAQREAPVVDFILREDGEAQRLLSVRDISASPLSVAVLVQDDVVSSISNEIDSLRDFIRRLPPESRVMVGYIRSGSLEVRQKFTTDLERAASALRVPIGSANVAPYSPYLEMIEALRRFESLPTGRRAMLVVTDGFDARSALDSASPASNIDLQRAIKEAQRRSVAVYSFYAPTVTAGGGRNSLIVVNAQGALETLAHETGGRAFFQGTGAPVSFDPFLRELNSSLLRQVALTYLSTHPDKGFHKIEILTEGTDFEIHYPRGYTRR